MTTDDAGRFELREFGCESGPGVAGEALAVLLEQHHPDACLLTGRQLSEVKVAVNGAGAAAIACRASASDCWRCAPPRQGPRTRRCSSSGPPH